MKAAFLFAEESKCAAKKVACILVKNRSIISIGINGTSPGAENCCDRFVKREDVWYRKIMKPYAEYIEAMVPDPEALYNEVRCPDQREHYYWSLLNEIHAEVNAIGKCSREGISTQGAVAYITHSPCYDCAKALSTAGIDKVFYAHEYDNVEDVIRASRMRIFKLDVTE